MHKNIGRYKIRLTFATKFRHFYERNSFGNDSSKVDKNISLEKRVFCSEYPV